MVLESHIDKLRKVGGERWQNLWLMTKAAKEYSGSTMHEETILGLFCKVSHSTLWCLHKTALNVCTAYGQLVHARHTNV
jgi:hypothetical protein